MSFTRFTEIKQFEKNVVDSTLKYIANLDLTLGKAELIKHINKDIWFKDEASCIKFIGNNRFYIYNHMVNYLKDIYDKLHNEDSIYNICNLYAMNHVLALLDEYFKNSP